MKELLIFGILISTRRISTIHASEEVNPKSFGAEVNNTIIYLDSFPLRSYTHYLQKTLEQFSTYGYEFTIKFMNPQIYDFEGTMYTFSRTGKQRQRKIEDIDKKAALNFTPRSEFEITITNSFGEISYLSDDFDWKKINKYENSPDLPDRLSLTVRIDFALRRNPLKRKQNHTRNYDIFNHWNRVGALTFTMFSDCTNSSNCNATELKSCSNENKTHCIASALFCDGEINCANGHDYGFDESSEICSLSLESSVSENYYLAEGETTKNTNNSSSKRDDSSSSSGFGLTPGLTILVIIVGILGVISLLYKLCKLLKVCNVD